MEQEKLENTELDRIFEIAQQQGVGGILFPWLYKQYNEQLMANEYWQTLRNIFYGETLKNVLYMRQSGALLQRLEQENIVPLTLKGLSIARLYANPKHRFMCDLDIYVKPDQWARAKACLLQLGYIQAEEDNYNNLHVKFEKQHAVAVELHRNLINSDQLGRRNKAEWYEQLWQRKKSVTLEEFRFYAMSMEDELIHQVTHFAAHFVYYGTKLKHLFEMALIIRSAEPNFDWHYVENTLRTIEMFDFAALLFTVCRQLFSIDVPAIFSVSDKEAARFASDLLNDYSHDKLQNDYLTWVRISSYMKSRGNSVLWQPVIWALTLRKQYKNHGFKLSALIGNSIRMIKVANKKLLVIKQYKLIVK